jgi:hypothetical protein
MGESKPVTLEDTILHHEVDGTLQENVTPHIKKLCSISKVPNRESLIPPVPYENLVISTINPFLVCVISNPSSPASSGNSSSGSVESILGILKLGLSSFILTGSPNPSMVHQHVGSLTQYLNF